MKIIYQNEVAECGYACLAMVLTHLGRATEVRELSAYRPVSANGIQLMDLYDMAIEFGLDAQAFQFDASDLPQIKKGSILHFGGAHFVIFEKLGSGYVRVIDPAVGRRRISFDIFTRNVSGYLIQCTATPKMERIKAKFPVPGAIKRIFKLNPKLILQLPKILFVGIGIQFATLAMPYLGNLVLDRVVAEDNLQLLNVLIFTFGSIFAIGSFSKYIQSYLSMLLNQRANLTGTESLFLRLLQNPLDYFEKRNVGDLFTRFKSQSEISDFATNTPVQFITDLTIGLLALGLMLAHSPFLTAVAVIIFALYLAVALILYPKMQDLHQNEVVQSAHCDDALFETIRGASLIKLAQNETRRTALYMGRFQAYLVASMKSKKLVLIREAMLGFIEYADTLIVTFISAKLMVAGEVSVGVFYSFLIYKSLMSDRLAKCVNSGFAFFLLRVPVVRVEDILEHEAEKYLPVEAVHKAPEIKKFNSLSIKNVSFSYGVSDHLILSDINLTINKGDKIAIVGASGSGKSTLFKLLSSSLAFKGELKLNGIAWENLSIDEIRRHSTHMRQGDIILHGSIADNVAMFEAKPDEDRINKLLEAVGLLDDIMQLPMRLRTQISDSIANISAGQRQRLLLARALYVKREVVMLDEPTSNLDPISVIRIANLLQKLNRTLLVITHDMGLANTFEKRYRLDSGRLSLF